MARRKKRGILSMLFEAMFASPEVSRAYRHNVLENIDRTLAEQSARLEMQENTMDWIRSSGDLSEHQVREIYYKLRQDFPEYMKSQKPKADSNFFGLLLWSVFVFICSAIFTLMSLPQQ